MGTEAAAAVVAGPTPRSGGRFQLALVFLLATVFSLFSTIPFLAFALVYGPGVAESIVQANVISLLWLLRFSELALFLVFYRLGRRFDFRGQYLQLAALSFAGVLAGALPELVSVQTTPLHGSSLIFAFQGVGLGNTVSLFVSLLSRVFENFAFPLAGLALAFLRGGDHLRAETTWPSASTGGRRFLSPSVLIAGVALVTAAYFASGLTDVVGSRLTQGQFAFLRSTLVVFSPYDGYAYDFFYPMAFFIVFYFLGKRLDTRGGWMMALAASVFAAGTLGFLLGNPLDYYVRAFAAPPGRPFPPFSFGLSFLADAVVRGLYVFALGFAAASLGFVRNMDHHRVDRDRLVAVVLIALVLVLFALSVFLGV
jgi:hypothetical protein